MTVQRFHVGPRLCQAVIHGDTAYFAGIVADHPIPDAAAQTGQILDQIDKLLAECGTEKSKILMATIWLADIRHFDEMNPSGTNGSRMATPPARACVEAEAGASKYLVEIRVVAAR